MNSIGLFGKLKLIIFLHTENQAVLTFVFTTVPITVAVNIKVYSFLKKVQMHVHY